MNIFFHDAFVDKTWYEGRFWRKHVIHKVTYLAGHADHVLWQNKKRISNSTRSVATKLDWMVVYYKEPHVTKVTSPFEHVVKWCHVTNTKHIFSSVRPNRRLTGWWFMKMGHKPQSSYGTKVTWQIKNVISISTWLLATKLEKMMDYYIGVPRTNSHDYLITLSYVVIWRIKYVKYPVPQVLWVLWTPNWQGGDFQAGSCMFKVNNRNSRTSGWYAESISSSCYLQKLYICKRNINSRFKCLIGIMN